MRAAGKDDMATHNPYPHPASWDGPVPDDETMAKLARYWTQIDGDTQGSATAERIVRSRLDTAAFDFPRTAYWHDPEGIDVFEDLPYLPDGGYGDGECRGHLLDLYLPHDAAVRGGHTLPVFIDIHGGGFSYGYKELNRNFCTHLAAEGFAVFNLNYRPAPQTDLKGQLGDIQAALRWIAAHLGDVPASGRNVFLTGDSAGGALAWLTALIAASPWAAAQAGFGDAAPLPVAGAALVSGAFRLAPGAQAREGLEHSLGDGFFEGVGAALLDPAQAVAALSERAEPLPALYLLTSSDDFIQTETLSLAAVLAEAGADFELHDVKVAPTQTLGHVFPVCMSWLDESRHALQQIRRFAYRNCR